MLSARSLLFTAFDILFNLFLIGLYDLHIMDTTKTIVPLSITDAEKGGWDISNSILDKKENFDLCLVGHCLTEAIVKFDPIRNTLADLWRLIGKVNIRDLGSGRIPFCFFYEVDLLQIINGGPWTFNNHLLVTHRIREGEDPRRVDIDICPLWVQVHFLSSGCFLDILAQWFGNFLGGFIDYDVHH